jgi:hypothetical protein
MVACGGLTQERSCPFLHTPPRGKYIEVSRMDRCFSVCQGSDHDVGFMGSIGGVEARFRSAQGLLQ